MMYTRSRMLYTHINWGGILDIDRGILRKVIIKPDEWKLMMRMGWDIGMDVLCGDGVMSVHFKRVVVGNVIHGEAEFWYADDDGKKTVPWRNTDHARYEPSW